MDKPIQVFISYAHEDEAHRARLEKSLKLMERQGLIAAWHDRRIGPSSEWKKEIDEALEMADLILLLVSDDFFASDYGWGLEMARALEKHDAGEARVVPIIVRACAWKDSPIGRLQVLPTGGKAVSSWPVQDEAWLEVSDGLRQGLLSLEQPRPPKALAEACSDGDAVLYVGAGMSAPAGFPTWPPLLRSLIKWARESDLLDEKEAMRLERTARVGEFDLVADNLVRALPSGGDPQKLNERLRQIFVEPEIEVPERHGLLKDIGFSAVLTTNFDLLLERLFDYEPEKVLTPYDSEQLLSALARRQFFISKLYGRPEGSRPALLAPSQYEDTIVGNQAFAEFMKTLFLSRTILFVGCSLDGIAAYLEGIRFQSGSRRHYALVAVSGNVWEAKADQLDGRYGIEVLPYGWNEGHLEVAGFLTELSEQVATLRKAVPGPRIGTDRDSKSVQATGLVHSLSLKNIGLFNDLELDLEPGWNILLGDNGLGKSTVLKAIALAFCGKEAGKIAGRLLTFGESHGEIVVRTERETYTTILSRSREGVQIESLPDRPLELEGWPVLGFPPLRFISWRPVKEQARDDGKRRPVSDDVLPLLSGEPDPRLDDLKDWIFSLDVWSHRAEPASEGQFQEIRADIFRILGELSTGLEISDERDTSSEDRLMISVLGKMIPIEALSQGTASLFGWLGVVMRRLYRIYSNDPKALRKPALVLLDEIDAHMHPGWQQTLIPNLKRLFPQLQFVVTTHSPLIVSNVQEGAIFGFHRDEETKAVRARRLKEHPMGLGVEGILSEFFRLRSQLDEETQRLLDEKVALVSRDEPLSGKNLKRLGEINEVLEPLGLLTSFADPYYTAFLRALARRGQLHDLRKPIYTVQDLERHKLLTDEILAELEAEEAL